MAVKMAFSVNAKIRPRDNLKQLDLKLSPIYGHDFNQD
jgi:hypothetical protein